MTNKSKSYETIPADDVCITPKLTEKKLLINKGPFIGKRHWLVLILALLSETTLSVKVYMSVCIVAMTDPTASSNKDVPTYNWTNKGVILSAYIWGLAMPQLCAGWFVAHYKAKWILVLMMGTCSIIGFLLPTVAAYIGSVGVIVCRVIQGMTMGTMQPCLYYLYGKWIPPDERSRLVGFVFSGSIFGIIISMFLSGQIAASRYGWPMVIYLYSSIGMLWCLLFAYVGSDSPAEHPTISREEKYYIQYSLSQVVKKKLLTPWRKILSSPYVWASIITRCGGYFGFFMILSEISNYLKNIVKIDIKQNGLFSALPYVCTLVTIYIFGFVADRLITRKVFNITTTRKIMVSVGCIIPCITLLLLANSNPEDKIKIILLLALTVSSDTAGNLHGVLINGVDLAPNHSGPIEGLANQIGQITSSMAPLLVHFLVKNETNPAEWGTVFYISVGIRFLTALAFVIFGTAEVQPWNAEVSDDDIERKRLPEIPT